LLLFDPQTSGGLLLGVPESKIETFLKNAESNVEPAWVVGEVVAGESIVIEK